MRGRALAATLALAALPAGAAAQTMPLTRAERTGWIETSRYADVLGFLAALDSLAPALHVTTFGYTWEGRALPLAVWDPAGSDADWADPAGLREAAGDRVRVLVVADIHAGEVPGKEAVLMILRDLAGGAHPEWADSLLVMFAPIYNADGNERVNLGNRPLQNGPIGGMGQRPDALGLDLNRDFVKLEAPESRSLVGLIRDADPHALLDLHTTDGTIHAYHLTYSPPLSPNTDPAIDRFLREEWLPAVTEAVKPEWRMWHYGNLASDERMEGRPRGWYTYDARPRYGTNYVGLRNRIGILSEAYAYATFEERVAATKRFVEENLAFAWSHAAEIRRREREADARSLIGDTLALSARYPAEPDSATVLLGAVDTLRHPWTGRPMLQRLEVVRPERMPAAIAFEPDRAGRVPAAYLVPPGLTAALDLLAAHGVRTEVAAAERRERVEEFRITASTTAEREFQGHRERRLEGEWVPVERTVPAGTVVVPMDQPLARLAFALLEPRSDDGLVDWNVLDPALEGAAVYPILRRAR